MARVTVPGRYLAAACFVLATAVLQAQAPNIQATTDEHLETEPWWPTSPNARLDAFAGTATCVTCHADEAGSHGRITAMQRAATLATDGRFLKGKSPATLTQGGFNYTMVAKSDGVEYSVTKNGQTLTRKLDWVMGAGELGLTFMYKADDRWYQSELSFYLDQAKLDITNGSAPPSGDDLATALGQPLSADDTRHCFGCHTVHATTTQGFNPLHAEAGVGCEACHGPSGQHVKQMMQASATSGGAHVASGVFDPSKLSPADSNDFCGSCHRSFSDARLSIAHAGTASTAIVRFQPYRLEESKCWRATEDARLTCVACHDPHQPLNRSAAFYDGKCLQCHAAGAEKIAVDHAGKVCPKATSGCASCHMPKVNIASMHGDFTDHFIRVAKAGEGFPK